MTTRLRTAVAFSLALAIGTVLQPHAVAHATPLSGLNAVLMYDSPSADTPVLGITGRIADDVALPAEVVLPTPEGAQIIWAGEFFVEGRDNILLGYRQEIREGIPVVVLTLSESRLAHVEMTYPGSVVYTDEVDGIEEVGFDIAIPVQVSSVYAAIAVPPTVEPVSGHERLSVSEEADGLRYYATESFSPAVAERVSLLMQLRPPVKEEASESQMLMLLGLLAASAAGLVIWRARGRRR